VKQTRYVTEVIARELILLSAKGGGEAGGGDVARAKATAKVAPAGKSESLDSFPEALDEENDDLPF
jgi:hypothetical protein